jgi:hypothetical protein
MPRSRCPDSGSSKESRLSSFCKSVVLRLTSKKLSLNPTHTLVVKRCPWIPPTDQTIEPVFGVPGLCHERRSARICLIDYPQFPVMSNRRIGTRHDDPRRASRLDPGAHPARYESSSEEATNTGDDSSIISRSFSTCSPKNLFASPPVRFASYLNGATIWLRTTSENR